MTLNKETKIGLTFGQILSLIGLMITIGGFWLAINQRITETEIRVEKLEESRHENTRKIEKLYDQNREDYNKIIERLDDIRDKLDTKQDKQ